MARAWLLGAGAFVVIACAMACAVPAGATPQPPASGDWVIDPGESANLTANDTVVHGNITLSANSALDIIGSRLILDDTLGKVSITGPASSRVTAVASTIAAAAGPANGGFGFYIHVDGSLTIEACSITGLSGLMVPTPVGETEGVHLTTSSSSVANSSITGAQGYAITVTAQLGTVTPVIEGNTITRNGGGVFAGGLVLFGANARVAGNAFSLNTLPDILVIGSDPRLEANSFFGSTAGVAVVSGRPTIAGNTFTAQLTAAVVVTSGGALISNNTITASGAGFQFIGSDIQMDHNSLSLTGAGLRASSSRVSGSDLTINGALGPAVSLNGSSLTLRGPCPMSSTLGAAAVEATNGSDLYLDGCDISSAQGAAVSVVGGSLVLDGVQARGLTSAVVTTGCPVTLRSANLTGGGSGPALSIRGSTLDLSYGSVTGGEDGVWLDNVSAQILGSRISGNTAWGIHAVHRAPVISRDDVTSNVSANGLGDLRVEVDLTVVVKRPDASPAANATVWIEGSSGAVPVQGRTDALGAVGPARLLVRLVDSLNNDADYNPIRVRALAAPNLRGQVTNTLTADQTWVVTLTANSLPVVTVGTPASVVVGTYFAVSASASDADNDSLVFTWTTDDGRAFSGADATMAFADPGNHTLTLNVSDGFETVVAVRGIAVLTPEQANRAPYFTTEPRATAQLGTDYFYAVSAVDPDADSTLYFQLIAGPLGMALLSQPRAATANLVWEPDRYFDRTAAALQKSLEVSLLVTDGIALVYQNFTLLLTAPPDQAPAWRALPALQAEVGASVTLLLDSYLSDADDALGTLEVRVVNVSGASDLLVSIDNRTGSRSLVVVALSSPAQSVREARVTIEAVDGAGLSSQAEVVVQIGAQGTAATPTGTGGPGVMALALLAATVVVVAALWAFAARQPPRKEE